MNHIKNYLSHVISNQQYNQNWKLLLIKNWNTIMGSLVTKVSICKIYNNAITLGVSDSSWMQELHTLSELIKDKINITLDQPRIQIVRFKYVSAQTQKTTTAVKSNTPNFHKKLLTNREQTALNDIKDPELSQALAGFLQLCHKYS